jgi:probable F420-dependent oxidoreductase
MSIRIAVQIPPAGTPSYSDWRDTVLRAEDAGADVVLGYDHFVAPVVTGRDENGRPIVDRDAAPLNNFESWTALASWAEIVARAEIGLLVGGAGFRNPDLLADMARTVDHISGGRLILGLGAGWHEPDYTEYGFEYGTVASRLQTFADALERITTRLPTLTPPPLRDIPILIGGSGERKTIPLVARYADIWHSAGVLDQFVRRSEVLVEHAQRLGRDPQEIERAVTWVDPDAGDAFAAAGAGMFTVSVFASGGQYDLGALKEAVAWRDSRA